MSSRNRRIKRKIAMLVRMDTTHHLCQMRFKRTLVDIRGKTQRIQANMRALGRTMGGSVQERAIAAINAQRRAMGRGDLQ